MKVARMLSADEGGGGNVVRPTMYMAMGAAQRAAAPPTPVESGTIEVRASVTVTLEVSQWLLLASAPLITHNRNDYLDVSGLTLISHRQ